MPPATRPGDDQVTENGAPGPAGYFSCVVDDHPRFHLDALRWFATLTGVAGVDPGDLLVHAVGNSATDALELLRARGVTVRPIDPFDPRSPHCNKISGALRLAEDGPPGMVVLCDTDVVVLEDPRRLALPPEAIAGKLVDAPVPPFEVILDIFAAAGVAPPPSVPLPWGTGQRTVVGNSNGGLYLVPGTLLPRVATAWAGWARWLLDRLDLFQQWTVYIDQVAMAMALADTGTGSTPLEVRWNTPIHDPDRIPAGTAEPSIIHYHQRVDRNGLLLLTGVPAVDGRIRMANDAIEKAWAGGFPESTYQKWLDLMDEEVAGATVQRGPRSDRPIDRARRFLSSARRSRS